MDYIYAADGKPQGFRLSEYIYTLDGTPVGRVMAEKAYRLDGTYVGCVVNNMIVDRPGVSRRSIRAHPRPEKAALPQNVEDRRPVGPSFPDCFEQLLTPADILTGV